MEIKNKIKLIFFTLNLILMPTSSLWCAQKVFEISRTAVAPKIDGKMEDEVWNAANWSDDFKQNEPDRLAVATERTVIRLLYDDYAVYALMRCYDREPGAIEAILRRRDDNPSSDRVVLQFDSRFDHQTAFIFGVNAGGLMIDGIYSGDGSNYDSSWDPVWEAESCVDDSGWVAEMKIPFTALRFPPLKEHIWGFNAVRIIHRKGEVDMWKVSPRELIGFVSLFGEIHGIRDIPQPSNFEVLPYVNAKYESTAEKEGYSAGAGCDLKWSLNSGAVLNAAINPDFGQVEADPAVLNLSVFETYFPEQRPFFTEGASFFKTDFQLFYSRRIGKEPGFYPLEDDEEIISQPENTTILNALKLTSKSSKGVSFGVIEAVTDREYGNIRNEAGEEYRKLIEPYSNYLVIRGIKDVLAGNSTVGAIGTALNRERGSGAYSGGIDWNLYFHQNDYHLKGQAAFSDRSEDESARERGYAFYTYFGKEGGKHHFLEGEIVAVSPDFNINDMGYIDRSDIINGYCAYIFAQREPYGIARKIKNWFYYFMGENYRGARLSQGLGWSINVQSLNFWWTGASCDYNFRRYSDLDTRGGPLIASPDNITASWWVSSDERKKTIAEFSIYHGENISRSWWGGWYWGISLRPVDRMETSVGIEHENMFDENQWVDNIEEDDSTHYVYGRLRHREWELTGRVSYNLNRDLSLQLYLQPYNAVGKYKEYVELAEPASYKFKPYDPGENYDFNYKAFNSNLVLRWEYAPGSTIFVVWNRGMEDESEVGSFDFAHNFSLLSQAPGNDIFMIKLNRWLNFSDIKSPLGILF